MSEHWYYNLRALFCLQVGCLLIRLNSVGWMKVFTNKQGSLDKTHPFSSVA